MPTVEDIATAHPIEVLTTTRVDDAARFMSDLGIGDVIVTDPATGVVVGMLTDRDITVRLVAHDLAASTTEVADIYTPTATTISVGAHLSSAVELMRNEALRRLPVVDADDKPVAIVTIDDLATCGEVTDADLADIIRSHAAAYRLARILPIHDQHS